jgi:UDP-N-acetylmuramate--alanine ligase
MEGKHVIAVAGSHGKTTTTSMIAWLLTALQQDPSFIVGGVITNLESNARAGSGDDFVIEADEYDHMFLGLKPALAVVTNVEHDHPDLFPTAESFQQAFRDFVSNLEGDGTLILCGEDIGALQLQEHLKPDQKIIIYGFEGPGMDYFAKNLQPNQRGGVDFEMMIDPTKDSDPVLISLKIPGYHNVLNSLAAFAVVDQMGLDRKKVIDALGEFSGSERRFDIRGEFKGVILVDDYAHHPTEIRTTLAAARTTYPDRRIWAVWQPHTYSRIQTLFSDFTNAFFDADHVIVLDVYAAREKKPKDFSLNKLIKEINNREVDFISDKEDAAQFLLKELLPGDLLLVFTAGDAIAINEELERAFTTDIAD